MFNFKKSDSNREAERLLTSRPPKKEVESVQPRSERAQTLLPPLNEYNIYLFSNYSEICYENEAEVKTAWKYIPQPLIEKSDNGLSSEFSTRGGCCGVHGVDLVTPAIITIPWLRATFPGPVNRVTINTGIFRILSKEKAFELASLLVRSIRECKELVVIGADETSEALSHLVNHLKVTSHLFANYVLLTRLDNIKMRNVPTSLFCLETATPQEILDLASKRTTINIKTFGAYQINKLLHTWASSRDTHIDTLTLMCGRTPDQKMNELDILFYNFKRVDQRTLLDFLYSFLKRQTGLDKLHWDAKFVSDSGVEVHRADGTIGTVCYVPLATRSAFTLHVTYPSRPELRDLINGLEATAFRLAKEYELSHLVCHIARKSKPKVEAWNHTTDMHRMKAKDRAMLRKNFDTDITCEKRAMERHIDFSEWEMNNTLFKIASKKINSPSWGYYTPYEIVDL